MVHSPVVEIHMKIVNPYTVKVIYLSFQPLEVVSRNHDSQSKVVENYSYLPNIYKSWCLNTHFIPNTSDFID